LSASASARAGIGKAGLTFGARTRTDVGCGFEPLPGNHAGGLIGPGHLLSRTAICSTMGFGLFFNHLWSPLMMGTGSISGK
jgi:hypothetical protein